ncbi:protoporphyrinogen/coproporphyrinogen oxidase [Bdellovibrio svalbardensis]|uniref:FAD-dependent oxidoreductase n=1 Tax=Bdellovibrio svalbardensis TaxID=2972972 RepID=A0ABT6DEP6_9BACT|nr:FAD-dependent oxidoreductase [Bdellovibrio svalbardensis]MDG0815303.1 FAD-dependent oxidoreductase [Bdellovibrio svalbardensis]
MKKISVIGAGFAGLTVSLRLAQKGYAVDLYESSSRVGGLLGTDRTEHGIAEHAANALIRTERAEKLFQELGITPSYPLDSSKKRFIFRYTPRKWPLTFLETLFFISKFLPKFLFSKSSLKPRDQETLENWGRRNLGATATEYLLGPAMQGIYGNEISGLSSKLILSPLFSGRREKYKGLLTGPGGMQDLINKIELRLKELGVHIHTNSSVDLKNLQGVVIIATPANVAAQLLEDTHAELSAILTKIRMSSLMSSTLFFSKAQETYKGFGCLIPRGFGIKTMGILMNSYIFKDRDKTYNETWIMGGVKEEQLLEMSDEAILKLIAEERFQVLGAKQSLLEYRINRWNKALPYYDLHLEEAQKKMADLNLTLAIEADAKKIFLHGNYLSGIGLSKILERSDLLAAEIGRQHG